MLFKEANYALHVAEEEKRRRKFEVMGARRTARLDQLLDPRRRTMGVDAAHLQLQEQEKAALAADAKADALERARETARLSGAVALLERREEEARRATLQAAAHQAASRESSDTYDLNDPRRVLKARPARDGLDDPRLGPSSAQVFAGEDPLQAERKELQKAQFNAWLVQIQAERDVHDAAEREAMMAYAHRSDGTAQLADQVEQQQVAAARARQVAAAEYNAREIEAKRAARQAEREWDVAAGLASMNTLVTRGAGMGLLAESMADGVSHASPSRIRPDYYRGRPGASGEATMRGYQEQMEYAARDKAAQRALDLRLAAEAVAYNKLAALEERRGDEARRRADREMREALDAQRLELQARRARDKAEHARAGFGPDFFEAFGKTDF